jgi:hypothetical protein
VLLFRKLLRLMGVLEGENLGVLTRKFMLFS